MLPFTKRNVRNEDDVINTGDFEVVPNASKPASVLPPASSPAPRVFARSTSDDEMTTLMPRKGMFLSSRPPAPITPVPMPKMPSSRPPRAMLEEPPTRQFMKPSSPPPPSVSPVAGPPRSSNRAPAFPPPSQAMQMAPRSVRPQPVPVQAENLKSDPKIDPPATVITARTRIVAARPTMSWAAALVAMGIFVGLVTAVVARGDADTLIDAAAAFVDPSSGHAAAAGASSIANVQTKADDARGSIVASIDTLAAVAPAAEAPKVAISDLPAAAAPLPPKPAPVAYAAPRRAAWHPAPRPVAHPKVEKAEKAEASEVVAAAPKASKKHAADDDDMTGASAADALARAQLEASLQ